MEPYWLSYGSFALVNAAIANASGRGALKYFLGSLFLGPILTLILAGTYEDDQGGLHLSDLWKGDVRARRADTSRAA